MNHSNPALWTIPKFNFWGFLPVLLEITKNLFTFSKSPDLQTLIRGLLQEPSDLGLNYLKNDMDSIQWATRLKGLRSSSSTLVKVKIDNTHVYSILCKHSYLMKLQCFKWVYAKVKVTINL